ncbi:hypothetical protein K493DRAFT_318927 [Basidiobolus meristosporus CBS 931.73]|uniref:Uncharacterized protein n=1 Tax=Basidiobolus meristosporus CBS 931.73 TaxID=1314790 RepID=A0A1Y1XTU6_9FUNG|nr:hypothetical protein K493DRAFT_318927 [Basidiobolus meristosporus CBS 931.73]|eukprot:ORX89133.1 hypothetical protein K493DRAFT_318927 [Basidiobolus meristosporus CBS 931.73]
MRSIQVFEEIQYSFKILANNDFKLPDTPTPTSIDPAALKNFALNKFWDKLWTEHEEPHECSVWKHRVNSVEHILHCVAPSRPYDAFVMPLMDTYLRKLGALAAETRACLEIFSKLEPTRSIALFRSILPSTLIERLIATVRSQLVLPILHQWSTLSTLWVYHELYLPFQRGKRAINKRMSIEYILNTPDSNHGAHYPTEDVANDPPLLNPHDPDQDFPRNPVLCI